jgi:hypothetical protein
LNSEGQVDSSWGDSDSDISDEDLPWWQINKL